MNEMLFIVAIYFHYSFYLTINVTTVVVYIIFGIGWNHLQHKQTRKTNIRNQKKSKHK